MPARRLYVGGFRVLLTIVAIAIGPSSTLAQRPAVRTFGVADGLPSDAVSTVLLDSRGFLWLGTRMGVSRFDGATFINYDTSHGLPGPIVNHLLEDHAGRVWVATNGGGIARFDPEAPTESQGATEAPMFRVFPVGSTRTTNRVNSLLQDPAGRLWAATDGGVFRADDPSVPRFDPVRLAVTEEGEDPAISVARLVQGQDGTLWLGSFRRGLFSLHPDGTVVSYGSYGTDRRDRREVTALLVDRHGFVWVGADLGVFVLKPTSPSGEPRNRSRTARSVFRAALCDRDALGRWTLPQNPGEACQLGLPEGLDVPLVRSLIETRDGRVVVPMITGQIAVFDGGHLRWWLGAPDQGPLSMVTEDRLGNLWVGNMSRGLSRVARSGLVSVDVGDLFRAYSLRRILGEHASALVLATSDLSVYRVEHRSISRVAMTLPVRPLPPESYGGVLNRGSIWLASGEGLFRVAVGGSAHEGQPEMLRRFTTRDGLAGDAVGTLFADSRGDVWISTGSGAESAIARWDATTDRIHPYAARVEGGRFSQVIAFAEDRTGVIWIAFRDGGLARIRGSTIESVADTHEVVAGHLFLDSRGWLWASGLNGTVRFADPAASRPVQVRYTTRDGLSSDDVRCFTEDHRGRMYLCTAAGLDRLDVVTGSVRHYGTAEGVPSGEIISAFTAANGTLWFATGVSLASLTPESDQETAQPAVRIGTLTVAGVPQPLSALGTETASGYRFGPSQNRLQIDFFGLSPDLIEPLRYQYRLEGLDDEWTLPTRDRSITYASLPSGSYRFGVRAVTSQGQVSESPAFVSFDILPPLWQRWWVIALAAAAVTTAIYAAHRYRLSHALRLERVRQRIATDLHDDIGASLSQMAILSDLGRRGLEAHDVEGTSSRLAIIAATSRELVDTMSDIVWAVNPHRDSVDDLVHRMRRFASDTLEAADISVTFTAPPEGATLRLGPDVRREILLILKEAVTNIVRHADATEAAIDLCVEGHRLHLRISDNGRGFDPSMADGGNGVRSMRRRVAALGGEIGIESSPGRGTQVAVTLDA